MFDKRLVGYDHHGRELLISDRCELGRELRVERDGVVIQRVSVFTPGKGHGCLVFTHNPWGIETEWNFVDVFVRDPFTGEEELAER